MDQRKPEPGWHDTDDGHVDAVRTNRLAHDCGIAAVARLPEAAPEDHNRGSARLIVKLREIAPEDGPLSDQLKCFGRNIGTRRAFRGEAAVGEIDADTTIRNHLRHGASLRPPILEIGVRHAERMSRPIRTRQHNRAFFVWDPRPSPHPVDDREHRDVCANRERHGRHHEQAKRALTTEQPKRVPRVAQCALHQGLPLWVY